MPKYRVKETSFIHNKIHDEGELVEYEGAPGHNLEPVDTKAKRAVKQSEASRKDSLARQQFAASGGDLQDSEDAPSAGVLAESGGAEAVVSEKSAVVADML